MILRNWFGPEDVLIHKKDKVYKNKLTSCSFKIKMVIKIWRCV